MKRNSGKLKSSIYITVFKNVEKVKSLVPSVSNPSSSKVGTPYFSSWSSVNGVCAPFNIEELTGISGFGGGPMVAMIAKN